MKYFDKYQQLGFSNPYYLVGSLPFVICKSFPEAYSSLEEEKKIDFSTILAILNNGYSFGDRTIIRKINKTPWQAKPNNELSQWLYHRPPRHGKIVISEEEIANKLFNKICNEITSYVSNKKNIGLLLSGGMDSRMVAGALDYLIKTKTIENVDITCITWGNDNSRDVVYAKEISSRLEWKWKHYKVNFDELNNNIYETAVNGCEYSPVHLHAIPQIRDNNQFDVILAGSYGDSVGRAEYSGRRVSALSSIDRWIRNVCGLFNNDIFNLSFKEIKEDIDRYHCLFPAEKPYMQNELDYQLHYMRRMLNPCMDILSEKSEFCQVFTHPNVFGFMWSIDPTRRNDLVYKFMLKEFSTDLSDIPWARTGLPFGSNKGIPDSYAKKHHSYVNIIYKELLPGLKREILNGKLCKLGIFNNYNVKLLLEFSSKFSVNSMYYAEKIIWLASFSLFLEMYTVNIENPINNNRIPNKNHLSKTIIFLSEYLMRKAWGYRRK